MITIDSNIPVFKTKTEEIFDVLVKMGSGDSFLYDGDRNMISYAIKRNNLNVKFKTQKQDGGIRVWKV